MLYEHTAYEMALVIDSRGTLVGCLDRTEVRALRRDKTNRRQTGSLELIDPRRRNRLSAPWERRALDHFNRYFRRVFGTYSPIEESWDAVGEELLTALGENVDLSHVLDLGAGSGRYGRALLARAPEASIVGLDLWINDTRTSTGTSAAPQLTVGSGAELPFRSGSFTLVLCFFVLEHVADPVMLEEEMMRVLAPGGTLAIAVPSTGAVELVRALVPGGRPTLPLQHVRTYGPLRHGFIDSTPGLARRLRKLGLGSIWVRPIGRPRRSVHKRRRLGAWTRKYFGPQTLLTGVREGS